VATGKRRRERGLPSMVVGGMLRASRPIGCAVKITANMVTIARIVLMPIPGYMLYGGSSVLLASLAVIGVLGLTDWLDGIMARREGTSVLGGLLDPIADKIFIAVIYLPLTERGVIPLWMTICIFSRDFLVTSLRTALMLRDAPMRTSTLAKFKTAIQMLGIGYVILYLSAPEAWYAWAMVIGVVAVPGALILYRLIRRQKQGPRSMTMFALFIFAVALRRIAGPEWASLGSLVIITGMTVISGFSYLMDAWGALRGKPGSFKEVGRFALDGLAMPVAVLLLVGRFETGWTSVALILTITLELASGGLGNLLASKKIQPRFRWIALKSSLQVLFAVAAFAVGHWALFPGLPVGEACVGAILGVTAVFAALAFWRHRKVYLSAI
jgi:cardiolipin synthase